MSAVVYFGAWDDPTKQPPPVSYWTQHASIYQNPAIKISPPGATSGNISIAVQVRNHGDTDASPATITLYAVGGYLDPTKPLISATKLKNIVMHATPIGAWSSQTILARSLSEDVYWPLPSPPFPATPNYPTPWTISNDYPGYYIILATVSYDGQGPSLPDLSQDPCAAVYAVSPSSGQIITPGSMTMGSPSEVGSRHSIVNGTARVEEPSLSGAAALGLAGLGWVINRRDRLIEARREQRGAHPKKRKF